jgi:hypothetical protein
MTTKYIHIGFPKNLSTSLQRDFFSKHPELMHLGTGANDHNLGYLDKSISIAVEFYLRYAKDYVYSEKKDEIKSDFEKYFIAAQNDLKIKAVGISNEHMSFNFTPDNIDVTEKAKRLHGIFGSNTKIIMLVRNQLHLIRSFYKECIRVGYTKSYAEYIQYLYFFHERNFTSDFFYDCTYTTYANLFGSENICLITMEDILENGELVKTPDGKTLLPKKLCDFLGLSYPDLDIGHYNAALNDAVIEETRKLNAQYPHDLGNIIYGTAESHRITNHFEKNFDLPPPLEATDNVKLKRRVIGDAMRQAELNPDQKINYDFDSVLLGKLTDLYRPHNKQLAKLTGLDFESKGYPV